MLTINSLTLSKHAMQDRAERIAFIEQTIGWGQIIKEVYYYGTYHYITDTGVALIVNEERTMIITAYLIDAFELQRIYNNKTPKFLLKKVKHYTKMGWVNTYEIRQAKKFQIS